MKQYRKYLEEAIKIDKNPIFMVLKGDVPIFSSSDESEARKIYDQQDVGNRPSQYLSLWKRIEEKKNEI